MTPRRLEFSTSVFSRLVLLHQTTVTCSHPQSQKRGHTLRGYIQGYKFYYHHIHKILQNNFARATAGKLLVRHNNTASNHKLRVDSHAISCVKNEGG
jgi:hypothetical protein